MGVGSVMLQALERVGSSAGIVASALSVLPRIAENGRSLSSNNGSVSFDDNSLSLPLEGNKNGVESHGSPEIVGTSSMSNNWIKPQLKISNTYDLQFHGSDDVSHAFRLLQTSSGVQAMVGSLASDPALWGAVMRNERVFEFKNKLERERRLQPESSEVCSEMVCQKNWWNGFTDKVFGYMDKMKKTVQGMFALEDQNVSENGHNIIISCSIALSAVALLAVLLKRS